jgi:hypothetical protein
MYKVKAIKNFKNGKREYFIGEVFFIDSEHEYVRLCNEGKIYAIGIYNNNKFTPFNETKA